jgi:hypothetical protein
VHLGMMAGDHFPRKTVHRSKEGIPNRAVSEEMTHISQFQSAVLRTPRSVPEGGLPE